MNNHSLIHADYFRTFGLFGKLFVFQTSKRSTGMSITDENVHKALQVRVAVNEFFETFGHTKIEAAELTSYFRLKRIFEDDADNSDPVLQFLNNLEEANLLRLIPQAFLAISESGMNWYFVRKPNTVNH